MERGPWQLIQGKEFSRNQPVAATNPHPGNVELEPSTVP